MNQYNSSLIKTSRAKYKPPEEVPVLNMPVNMNAKLRNYQIKGYNWLAYNTMQNYGLCLADDMGLGKTLQIITVLAHYFENIAQQTSFNQKNIQYSLFEDTYNEYRYR